MKKKYDFLGTFPPNKNNSHIELVYIMNQNTHNIPSIICRQFSNLHELRIVSSSLRVLTDNSLINCQNLIRFQSTRNPVHTITENFFTYNPRLMKVIIEDGQIEELPGRIFQNNPQLTDITFSGNFLQQLPNGIFDRLRFLRSLAVSNNNLSTIDTQTFGYSALSLVSLRAENNRILSIDRNWFNQSRNLQFLHLRNNICVNQTFEWIGNDRFAVEQQLERCFNSFGSYIRCNYNNPPTTCFMNIFNPLGRDDFDRIEG